MANEFPNVGRFLFRFTLEMQLIIYSNGQRLEYLTLLSMLSMVKSKQKICSYVFFHYLIKSSFVLHIIILYIVYTVY